MVEMQAELLAQVLQSDLGQFAVAQEGLAIAHLIEPRGVLVHLVPGEKHLVGLVQLARVLIVQAVVEIIFLGARHKFFEYLLAVFAQREPLQKVEVLCRRSQHHEHARAQQHHVFREPTR